MKRARSFRRRLSSALGAALPLCGVLLSGCEPGDAGPAGTPTPVDPTPAKPSLPPDSAAAKYPDLPAFFERSVQRTCSPNFGVCHRSRQYPDMTTASHLVQYIGRRCNELRDDLSTVDNLCEPQGDTIALTGLATYSGTVGGVRLIPDGSTTATATGVALLLREPLPAAAGQRGVNVAVVRSTPGLPPLSLMLPANSAIGVAAEDNALVLSAVTLRALVATGGVRWLDFFVPPKYLPGSVQQVVLGDPNGDGVYGAELGGREIAAGDPARSYLYVRTIMPLASPSMEANTKPPAPVIESQMPLANYDYWDIDNAAYAMYCWIKGLRPDGKNAMGAIDYGGCGEWPMALRPRHQGGEARTWSAIWMNVIAPNCATQGCHDRGTRAAALDLGDPQGAYNALWNQPSTQVNDPEVKLVYPSNPDGSYLVQKLRGEAAVGGRMPLGRELPARDQAIDAVVTWINQGARNN